MHPLTRPRRIVTAVLIFAVLSGGGLVGLAFAADAPEPVQLPFTFAMPREGDRGAYEIEGDDPVFAERGDGTYTFEMRPRDAIVDASGTPRLVDEFTYHDDRFPVQTAWDFPVREGVIVDAVTSEPLADVDEWTDIEDGGAEVGEARSYYYFGSAGNPSQLPCGLHNALQGQILMPGDSVPGVPCADVGARIDLVLTVRAVGEGGNGSIVDLTADGQLLARLHYNKDLAYPAEILIYDRSDVSSRWTLTAFEPGEEVSGDVPLPAPVVLETSPRTESMFDDSGIDHPFPASEAVRRIIEDPETGTADFLADNPEAYIVDGSYWGYQRDGRPEHEWRFTWRDADSIHHVNIGMRNVTVTEEVDGGQSGSLLDEVLGGNNETQNQTRSYEETEYYYFDTSNRDLADYGRFYAAPTELPTVASMWAFYDALARPELVEAGANHWEWIVLEGRGGPRILLEAGRFMDYADGRGEPGVEYERDWAFLEWDWAESQEPFRYSDRGFIRTTQPQPAATTAVQSTSAVQIASFVPFTPATAAGIGIGAAVAALGYYLWPLAKGAGLGLFSRVRNDKVLDHPTRRSIHEYITANPGCHYHGILDALGLAKGTLQHHVAKLEAAGLVTSAKSAGYRCFFVRGERDHKAMQAHGALKSDVAKQVFHIIRTEPGASTGSIATRIGVSAPTVSYHLRRMREAGLLVQQGRGYGASETALAITV